MSLLPGTKLGAYEVSAKLGEGGMGEVYRARDLKLGRDVALKILPEAFATDAERLARFEREARTLASLNHPHIAQVYGFEDGAAEAGAHHRALVMELVEGEELSARIARGPIPLDEALPVARQIAEALEAAHDAGHHPSRSQAREHQIAGGRQRQGAGFWSCQGRWAQVGRVTF